MLINFRVTGGFCGRAPWILSQTSSINLQRRPTSTAYSSPSLTEFRGRNPSRKSCIALSMRRTLSFCYSAEYGRDARPFIYGEGSGAFKTFSEQYRFFGADVLKRECDRGARYKPGLMCFFRGALDSGGRCYAHSRGTAGGCHYG